MNLAKILAFSLSLTFSTTPALAHLDFKLDEPVSQAKKEPKPSRYARDRKVDIQKLSLDVTPNFGNKSIAGSVILQFTPIAKPLEELTLDAVRMTVKRLICSDPVADYQVTDSEIAITFAKPIPVGQEVTLTIDYSAYPQKGLYFRSPATGYPQAEEQIFSQGEMIESRHWFPCYDYPNMKFKSEITCHVPEGMTVLSNGKVVSSEKDSNTGLCAVHWYQDKPHVSYLVTLVAGYFAKLDDKYRDIDLTFYFPPSEMEGAKIVFPTTKPALAFFEEEIGVPFPWAQYGQVVVRDHPTGGMENTTITTLNDMFMPAKELENIGTDGVHTPDTGYYTSENAMAHELAHQWFGDYVTCKDWSHSWLNEGFATYYAFLFLKKRRGIETFRYGQYEDLKNIAERPSDDKPIVNRKYESEWEQFDQTTYEKGAWVLHMLRSQLGEELYRKCIKTYLERHKFGTVSTEDLNSVIEELSGRSFDAFFDQWLYHAGIPSLNVTYSWNQKSKLAKVSIYQTQKVDDKALLFDLPVPLQFKTKRETINKTVDLKSAHEDFYIPLSEPPDLVRIDPELTLLADIHFDAPQAMLNQQLADPDDMVGRLIALEHLEKNSDPETIKKVKDILNNDSFYGVRIKASNCLKKMHTDEALNALISSVEQPDARVRFAVIRDIGNYFTLARERRW